MAQVIVPRDLTSAPAETEINLVRGDKLDFDMGFAGVPDIAASLAQFRLRMVFRARQSDTLPDILVLNADLLANPPDTFRGQALDIMATFTATPTQTQSLPARGCVFFIEWTNAAGGDNRRVVQGRVITGD